MGLTSITLESMKLPGGTRARRAGSVELGRLENVACGRVGSRGVDFDGIACVDVVAVREVVLVAWGNGRLIRWRVWL